MSGPRIGELFAGYGGLGMGVQAALGGEMAWYSEIDKGALKILEHRFPDVPNVGDITTADWSQVEPVDILTGGSPCQDLSQAGKRAGMTEGTRSNLWVAMREAIAQLRPSLVIWENVRGAYSAEADSDLVTDPRLLADTRRRDGQPVLRALGRVLGDLSDLGYVGGWHGLRAADVGAPHGRFRVFVVAYAQRGELARQPVEQLRPPPVAGSGRIDSRGQSLLPTPRTSDTNGAGRHGEGGLDLRTAVTLLPTPSVADSLGGHLTRSGARSNELPLPGVARHLAPIPTPLNSDAGPRGGTTGFGLRDWSRAHVDDWGEYAPAVRRWAALTSPVPSPTEPSSKGTPRLSPRFSEWMLGLPVGWVTDAPGITRNEALKALGNGVVPQQAEAAVRFLLRVIEVAV